MLKVMNKEKILGVVEEWSATDRKYHPNFTIVEDNEHQVSDYVMCEEEYLLRDDPRAIESEQNRVRCIRNSYLEQFVDPVASNALRWADMSEEEKQIYMDYRRYLLEFTEQENWWESNPLTLEEWNK